MSYTFPGPGGCYTLGEIIDTRPWLTARETPCLDRWSNLDIKCQGPAGHDGPHFHFNDSTRKTLQTWGHE